MDDVHSLKPSLSKCPSFFGIDKPSAPGHASIATTALTLDAARGDEASIFTEYDGVSSYGIDSEQALLRLLLDDVMHLDRSPPTSALNPHTSYVELGMFPRPIFDDPNVQDAHSDPCDDGYYTKYLSIDKGNDSVVFHQKLKHFFILSSAGKPIYSLHGQDNVILGYMGIITTIISAFNQGAQCNLRSVRAGNDCKICVLDKSPILLVAISKIGHEFMDSDDSILESQLNTLHSYLISILSQPAIDRAFHNRMNYDLRRVLTPLDFYNLDALCMSMTYGLPPDEIYDPDTSLELYMGKLFSSSQPNIKITNTTRKRLLRAMTACRKMAKRPSSLPSPAMMPFNSVKPTLGDDLLFSLITTDTFKIISYGRPPRHTLCNDDLRILFSTIESTRAQKSHHYDEDLWVPLCMPKFNSSGFLYVHVSRVQVISESFMLVLVSGSKNAFYDMRDLAAAFAARLLQELQRTLARELFAAKNTSLLREIQTLVVSHFIYVNKRSCQYVMTGPTPASAGPGRNQRLQLAFFYTALHRVRATTRAKHLNYVRWSGYAAGLMYATPEFEFCCIASEDASSKQLIAQSLTIIRWCQQHKKRLFAGSGHEF